MKRLLILISFTVLALTSSAQKYQDALLYGENKNRADIYYLLGIPNDTFAIPSYPQDKRRHPHVAAKDNTIYLWDTTAYRWNAYAPGGGIGGGITNLGNTGILWLNRVNDSTYKADSAAIAGYLLRRKDSASASNPLGYVTLKLLNDSLNKFMQIDTAGKQNRYVLFYDAPSGKLKFKIDSTAAGGGSGTVTSVGTGYGLSGGTITATGTILVDSATLAGYMLRRKDSLTTSNPLGYVTKKILADSSGKKVDTNRVVIIDTTYRPDSALVYWDSTTRKYKHIPKSAVGGGGISYAGDNDSTFKLSFNIGDELSPTAGDSSLVHSKFQYRNLKIFINGEYFHQRDSMGYDRSGWDDSITIHKTGGWVKGDRVDVWATDTIRYAVAQLEAPPAAGAPIAYVSSTDGGNNGGSGTTRTFSFTVSSATNRILLVGFVGDLLAGNDDVSSVTYNGVPMTLANKVTAGGSRYSYVYYLLNPATGSNNVVITFSSSHWIIAGAAEYSGVQGIDVMATNSTSPTASSLTTSVTTTTNNNWNVLFSQTQGLSQNAGSGATKRVEASNNYWALFDSNGPLTPAGSHSMETTFSSLISTISHHLISLKPY